MELMIVAVAVIIIATILFIRKRKKGAEEVPQGLQVFDENGNCIVDITERITKYLGTFTVPTNADSGTVANSEIGDGDLWYVIEIDALSNGVVGSGDNVVFSYPVITKGDGQLNWSYPHSADYTYRRYGVTVHYGVY